MFENREEAGDRLADALGGAGGDRTLVLGLSRGGVPVAARVAEKIGAPMDVVVVRKVPVPGSPETAIGAVTAEGPPLFDLRALEMLGLSAEDLSAAVETERAEVRRQVDAYRGAESEPEVGGKDVIVVDDGLATGMSARAALTALRERSPASLVLAAPVGASGAVSSLAELCDRVVCLESPVDFRAVSLWYREFPQVGDGEVRRLLRRS